MEVNDAYVLFGGVGSGKTGIARQIAKASDTRLVSAGSTNEDRTRISTLKG